MTNVNSLKKYAFGIAKKYGYTIIPNWRLHSFTSAEHLLKLFEMLEIDLVFDVGANTGQYYKYLRNEVGYQGLVVSFEPTPNLAQILKKRLLGKNFG